MLIYSQYLQIYIYNFPQQLQHYSSFSTYCIVFKNCFISPFSSWRFVIFVILSSSAMYLFFLLTPSMCSSILIIFRLECSASDFKFLISSLTHLLGCGLPSWLLILWFHPSTELFVLC